MERKKDSTRMLLADSLQTLMLKYPFEKITIKMVTDEAGVIRPTFYNYFQDKYALLEWIFKVTIIDRTKPLLSAGMEKECVRLFFVLLDHNKAFYKKAFEITGQNSFEGIMLHHIQEMFLERVPVILPPDTKNLKLITPENISFYYTTELVHIVKIWLTHENGVISVEDVIETYYYLISHTIFDVIHINL